MTPEELRAQHLLRMQKYLRSEDFAKEVLQERERVAAILKDLYHDLYPGNTIFSVYTSPATGTWKGANLHNISPFKGAMFNAPAVHTPTLPTAETDKPILAVRGWDYSLGRLWPLSLPAFHRHLEYRHWKGPVSKNDAVPTPLDYFGYWAIRPDKLDTVIQGYDPDVIGIVELSGTVIEHTDGYRAEIATIRSLYTRSQSLTVRIKLEDRYQCEVMSLNEFNLELQKLEETP